MGGRLSAFPLAETGAIVSPYAHKAKEIRENVAGELIVSVLVPVAVAAPYTYRAPAGCQPGDIVSVPLGTRDVVGVVWDDPPDASVGHNRLRPINGTFDAPPLAAEIRRFVDWVADYTLTSRGMVLRMVLRAPGALEPEAPVPGVRLAGPPPERMTPARQRVLAMLRDAKRRARRAPTTRPGRRAVLPRRPASAPAWCRGWWRPARWRR